MLNLKDTAVEHNKKESRFIVKLSLCCLFLVLMMVGLAETSFEYKKALTRNMLKSHANLIAQHIQKNISNGTVATEILHLLLQTDNYQTSSFENWAQQIVDYNMIASNVQLAPHGVVSYIYPLQGNEKAIGHRLFQDKERNNGALQALKSRETTFIGPIRLIQNNRQAVIVRKPIFNLDNFWGFATALLYLEDILPEEIYEIEEQGIAVKLQGSDPDQQQRPLLFISKNWQEDNAVQILINVPHGQWLLELTQDSVLDDYMLFFHLVTILLSTAVGGYVFFQQYQKHNHQNKIVYLNNQLTKISLEDELTSVGNRRSCMQNLEKLIQHAHSTKHSFAMLSFDIDYFKDINDQYGHATGDRYLCYIASLFKSMIRDVDIICRLGGDEFIVLFPDAIIDEALKIFTNIIAHTKKHPFRCEDLDLEINISAGLVEFQFRESASSLLRRVDSKLYQAKRKGRNNIQF